MLLPNVASLGFDRVKIIVSSISSSESSIISIVIIPLVDPALMVKVPLDKLWSVPEPVAVPDTS